MAAQDDLQLNARIFQTLAENALEAILVFSAQGNVVYANRAAYRLYRYDYAEREMIGTCEADYWPEQESVLFNQMIIPRTMAGGWIGEVRHKRADGSIFNAEVCAFPSGAASDTFVGMTLIIRDMAERKCAEADWRGRSDLLLRPWRQDSGLSLMDRPSMALYVLCGANLSCAGVNEARGL